MRSIFSPGPVPGHYRGSVSNDTLSAAGGATAGSGSLDEEALGISAPSVRALARTQACAARTHAPWYNIEINRLRQRGEAGVKGGLMRGRNPRRSGKGGKNDNRGHAVHPPLSKLPRDWRVALLSGSVVLTGGEEKVAEIDDSLWAVHTL